MLPKVNGYEICRAVRAKNLDMPVIMLTAKGQEEDIIRGLELGADDYVTKPFNIRELVARVAAFLRRRQAEQTDTHRFGDCELDLVSHRFIKNGSELTLTPKEFKLLAYFVRRPDRALTRNDIIDEVWGRNVIVTGRSVDRCITTLRNKVEPDPQHPTYIQTIRDIGYRFQPPATAEEPDTASESATDNTATNEASVTGGITELELQRARDIQTGLVPQSPSVQGLDIAIGFEPLPLDWRRLRRRNPRRRQTHRPDHRRRLRQRPARRAHRLQAPRSRPRFAGRRAWPHPHDAGNQRTPLPPTSMINPSSLWPSSPSTSSTTPSSASMPATQHPSSSNRTATSTNCKTLPTCPSASPDSP